MAVVFKHSGALDLRRILNAIYSLLGCKVRVLRGLSTLHKDYLSSLSDAQTKPNKLFKFGLLIS